MLLVSATDLAISRAKVDGSIKVTKCEGRFGSYWAIEDSAGLIEVHLTEADATKRVAD